MRGNEVIEELRRKVENGGQVSREEAGCPVTGGR